MALALDGEPPRDENEGDETHLSEVEIEAILDAMEEASPGSRAECIGGNFTVNFTVNQPRPLHQHSLTCLLLALRRSLPDHLLALPEIRVMRGQVWLIPDVVVVEREVLERNPPLVDPDEVLLIAEVLSPSTRAKDRGPKLDFYREHGIDYWLVEPGDPWGTIEAHSFGDAGIDVPGEELAR